MRDIRPAPKSKKKPSRRPSGTLPRRPTSPAGGPAQPVGRPIEQTAPQPAKPVKLVGSKVGVSNIDVPDAPDAPAPAPKPVVTKKTLSAVTKPKFASLPKPRMPKFRAPRVGQRERMIIFILLGLVVVIGALGALLFLPKADIRLVLRTAPLLVDESLTLQAGEREAGDIIPGTAFFREVLVESTSPVASTRVVGEPASGTVFIVNRSIEPQSLKEQSRLETEDGVLFYMQKGVTVPAANGGVSSVTVEVVAAEAGEQGNIEAQRLNFPGLDTSSQTLLYAEVETPLTGGSGDTVPFVTESDLLAAQQHAGTNARGMVESDIRNELPNGWAVLEESWTGEIADFDTPVGLESEESSIPYRARVVVRVMGYEEAALEQRLRTALEDRMQAEYMLFPGDISYTKTVQNIDWDAQTADISARVTHTTIPRFQLATLRDKLVGQSAGSAREYLEGLPGVRSADLSLSPFWVSAVPRIPSRVDIELVPERQP